MTRPTVLLVEDHVDIRRAMVLMLRASGFDVTEAATVAEGIANVADHAAALLDLHLPDGEGTAVCQVIRQQTPRTRVAFVTASHDPDKVFQATGCRPDAVFQKPVNVSDIVEWLRAVV